MKPPTFTHYFAHPAGVALGIAAGLLVACATPARSALDPKYDPTKVTIPALHPIPKVTPERTVLSNGLVIYLLEDHTLPRVNGVMYFKSSTTWVSADKKGLGGLAAQVMRTGGSAAKSGDWMDDRLAALGASINSNMSPDLANAGFRCLSDNTVEVMGLLADVLRRPAFPEDKIELAKVALRRQIASRNDEMQSVLGRVASQAVFGKESPYARTPEYATVEAITRDDCVKFHELCYSPDRAILVVYGDFESAAMRKLVRQMFGDWAKSATKPPAMPPMPEPRAARLVFAPKEDVTQSGVILAHLGFRNDDPDVANLDVFSEALGGGFQSRLFNKIRSAHGLAYATGATAGGGFLRPGTFTALTLTRNDSLLTALQLLRDEVARATKEPFSEEEVRNARESVLNSLVFKFESPADVVFRAAFYELGGYPADYLQKYQEAVAKVTPQTMLAAAQRHVHPDQLATIVVGKEKEFERPLESVGLPMDRWDISIPPPPSKLKAGTATASDLATGQAWLKRAAALAGGSSAWAALKSWSQEGNATLTMQGQSMAVGSRLRWVFPSKLATVQKLPMGEMTQGFDGRSGWRKGFGKLTDQPELAETVAGNWERSLFHLFAHPDDFQVQALPDKKTVDGMPYNVALVKSAKVRDWQLFFAPDGKLAGMEYADKGPQGDAAFSTSYSDWRPLGAIQYPYLTEVTVGGQPFMKTTITDVKANPAIADDEFRKPTE